MTDPRHRPPPQFDDLFESGQFTIRKYVGSGTAAQVFEMVDNSDKRQVVGKFMNYSQLGDDIRKLVVNEGKVMKLCRPHPNIIRLYKAYQRDNNVLLVSEFADGGDIENQLKLRRQSVRPFLEQEALYITVQLCLALADLHSQRILHRDIKAANVLMNRTGVVKLADFGFSRHYDASVSGDPGQTFCGTPYYLAPEVWGSERQYGSGADMWSLGVLLYELVSLHRPFEGRDIAEISKRICRDSPARAPLEKCSEAMRSLILRLLTRDSRQRPSAADVLREPLVQTAMVTMHQQLESLKGRDPATIGELMTCIAGVLGDEQLQSLGIPRPPPRDAAGDEA